MSPRKTASYSVRITESVSRIVQIEAHSAQEALKTAYDLYQDGFWEEMAADPPEVSCDIYPSPEPVVKVGRPRTTIANIPSSFHKYYAMFKAGSLTISDFAKLSGLSRPTVYKYLHLIQQEESENESDC